MSRAACRTSCARDSATASRCRADAPSPACRCETLGQHLQQMSNHGHGRHRSSGGAAGLQSAGVAGGRQHRRAAQAGGRFSHGAEAPSEISGPPGQFQGRGACAAAESEQKTRLPATETGSAANGDGKRGHAGPAERGSPQESGAPRMLPPHGRQTAGRQGGRCLQRPGRPNGQVVYNQTGLMRILGETQSGTAVLPCRSKSCRLCGRHFRPSLVFLLM